ncbi:MAG: type II secretion system F family protein [Selenomonadaceae bacterium]|nr:type II secretion system F family protein [Selenomonadaceae bacterium]
MLLIAIIFGIGTFFIFLFLAMASINRRSLDLAYRMRRHSTAPIVKKSTADDLVVKGYQFLQKISKPLVDINFAQSLEYKMRQAGLPLLGGEYIVLNFLGMILAGILVWFITLNYIFAGGVAALVPLIFWAIILNLKRRRLNSFTEQLGTSLITISNALRAGYSFQQTIEVISNEMEPPIGEEFSEMYHQIVMGVSLEEVLEDANKRIASSDFELAVTAVLIQREVGGNLAQILDNISATIMERIRMRREIESVTAQGRLSAMVLLGLPFAAGFGMFTLMRENFMMLFEDPIGKMAVVAAVIFEIVGYFVIMKIVDIEV